MANLPRTGHHTQQLQRGLTLTETVTALVLLAIGVLCIATVYLERTQAAPAVLLHSKANRLATEMAERMRTQRSDQVHFDNPVGVRCKPQLTNAPAQQLVTNDIACWQDKVAQTLPNGSGAIAHDSQRMTSAYLITVSWSPPDRGTASYLLRVEAPNANTPSAAQPPAPSPNQSPNKSAEPPPKTRKPITTSPQISPTDATRAAN